MRSVAVYCGSAVGNDPIYRDSATALGVELARRGLTLVYGGGNVGLMGVVANAVLDAGGSVIGVIPRQLADLEMAHPGLTRLEVVETMAQRKSRMEELADAFVAMPGGIGTLEELAEVLTMQQLGLVKGPVGLLNVNGFWETFHQALRGFVECGFVQPRYVESIAVEEDPAALLESFAGWVPLGNKWAKNPIGR